MSVPNNPLEKYDNVTIRHMMVAFANTQDASTTEINDTEKKLGEEYKSECGVGIVILNEFEKEPGFVINRAEWTFEYYSPLDRDAAHNAGYIEVLGKVGTSYLDYILTTLPQIFGGSVSTYGFSLQTFFIGTNDNGSQDIIKGKPYVFHVPSIIVAPDANNTREPTTMLMTVSPAHTMAQLPNYANVYQMTLTNESGNLHDTIPEPQVKSHGLIPRAQEDAMKYPPRQIRLDKSAPMKTLGEVFSALEKELDEQKYTHKAQLQEWLRYIRDDHVDKIVVPPKQKKVGVIGDALPIVFKVKLHDGYGAYPVDNINIPFEQPEQSATQNGIRSITVEPSTSLVETVRSLMRLSTKVGDDANSEQPEMPRVSVCVMNECDRRYHVYIHVNKAIVPWNTKKKNTGPGAAKNGQGLELYGNTKEPEHAADIISVVGKMTYSANSTPLEVHNGDEAPASIVYGDREQITLEREQKRDYFNTMFSGVRPMYDSFKSDGLQRGDKATMYETLNNAQYSTFTVLIRGNSDLLNDTHRRPHKVALNSFDEEEVKIYPRIETDPMYVKLLLRENPYDEGPFIEHHEHTFDEWYHMSAVKNIFGGRESKVHNREFVQEITLRRTDNTM